MKAQLAGSKASGFRISRRLKNPGLNIVTRSLQIGTPAQLCLSKVVSPGSELVGKSLEAGCSRALLCIEFCDQCRLHWCGPAAQELLGLQELSPEESRSQEESEAWKAQTSAGPSEADRSDVTQGDTLVCANVQRVSFGRLASRGPRGALIAGCNQATR